MAKKRFLVTFHVQKDGRMTLGTAVHTNRHCGALASRRHNPATYIPGTAYYNERHYLQAYEVDGPILAQMLAKGRLCKRCPSAHK